MIKHEVSSFLSRLGISNRKHSKVQNKTTS